MTDKTLQQQLDEATQQRLAKLRAMPIDTSHLDLLIEAQIPRPTRGMTHILSLRPVRALAASVALLGIIGVVVWSLSGGAVLASPATMASFHEDMISGKVPAIEVKTIDEANAALADQWKHDVEIPQMPENHVMMCCMRNIEDKRVACVLLKSARGAPVTMAVARSMDMRLPKSERVVSKGVEYRIESSGALNMVMTERDGRWICLIASLPDTDLIELAAAIKFQP